MLGAQKFKKQFISHKNTIITLALLIPFPILSICCVVDTKSNNKLVAFSSRACRSPRVRIWPQRESHMKVCTNGLHMHGKKKLQVASPSPFTRGSTYSGGEIKWVPPHMLVLTGSLYAATRITFGWVRRYVTSRQGWSSDPAWGWYPDLVRGWFSNSVCGWFPDLVRSWSSDPARGGSVQDVMPSRR